jgi:hypothetical protein
MHTQSIDPVLMAVVRLAEHGLSISATISVYGTVLSGRVISQRRFLQQVRKQFNSHVHEENLPGLLEILTLFEEVTEESAIPYLHLEKAAFLTGSFPSSYPKGYWRVRLGDIGGFSFGT